MIDLRLLREDPDAVRASQIARGEPATAVDELVTADGRRREAMQRFEVLRAEQKQLSKRLASAAADEKESLVAQGRELSDRVKQAEAATAEAEQALRDAHLAVPNVVEDGVPHGGEDDFAVLRKVGTPPTLADPRDHLELGQLLGAVDVERGAKVAGSRFYYLTGPGAVLQLGLLQLAMSRCLAHGFTPMVPPVLVKPEAMDGTGFLGDHAGEVYRLAADDLYLVGTSEVPLAAYHGGEILDLAEPVRYAGWSTCFRREAGSHGRDVRGILRVHQFDKVEMFVFCCPEQAHEEHLRLLAWEEELLGLLELPYRVIDVAAGDLGAAAGRKYDCEAWVPSQGRYREMTSTSNCTTYQARRLHVRYRDADGRTATAATLNGTAATTRWLIPLLENHQQPDGSVRVPEALRPYLGREVLAPAG